jgi:ParB-like chromosome segregation protein Spo0J
MTKKKTTNASAHPMSDLASMKHELVYVSPDKLKPYDKNARKHPEKQIIQIAASITANGFQAPIIVDKDWVIISGHGRHLAATRLQLKEVPVIRNVAMTKKQAMAYRLADNQHAKNSKDDPDLIRAELKDLILDGVDMQAIGFSDKELKKLIPDVEDPEDLLTEKESKKVISKTGDIWLLGEHRIVVGKSSHRMADMAIAAWQQATKKIAVHAATGEPFGVIDTVKKAANKNAKTKTKPKKK